MTYRISVVGRGWFSATPQPGCWVPSRAKANMGEKEKGQQPGTGKSSSGPGLRVWHSAAKDQQCLRLEAMDAIANLP